MTRFEEIKARQHITIEPFTPTRVCVFPLEDMADLIEYVEAAEAQFTLVGYGTVEHWREAFDRFATIRAKLGLK